MTVLSIDLASRRYRDIGIAVLDGSVKAVRVTLVRQGDRGLEGEPDPSTAARFFLELASDFGADVLLIDGPQGWRSSGSAIEHMRVCERYTLTPGKTGLPGVVKPRPWTRMANFSISVFDALDSLGWPRFTGTLLSSRPIAIESFPTHAWRKLGFEPLPGKKRGTALETWSQHLSEVFGVKWKRDPSHDEIQAVVAGIGGLCLRRYGLEGCDIQGDAPCMESGTWREGYILSPKRLG